MNKQRALILIKDALDINEWNYSVRTVSEEQTKYELSFTYDEYGCRLDTEILYIQGDTCEINMTVPVTCPSERNIIVSRYLMNRNLTRRYTSMQLWKDGKIICHYAFTMYDGTNPSNILSIYNMVKKAAMEDYLKIVHLCNGELESQEKAEILDEIERLKIALYSDSSSEEVFDELKIKL